MEEEGAGRTFFKETPGATLAPFFEIARATPGTSASFLY